MAGAGYKLFNTGDVLTAAQVNTYLQEQVVMVFANATARTTALSGVLAEGMMSYLQDTNAVEVYDGSAWVSIGSSGDITGITTGANSGLTGGVTSGTADLKVNFASKGQLAVGTGSGTTGFLNVGTNGHTLVADSSETTGLKWAAPAGGGKLLQVINADTATSATSSSSTYIDTNLTASITPSSTGSKVLVTVHQAYNTSTSGVGIGIKLFRGATELKAHGSYVGYSSAGGETITGHFSISYLDSPNTTSSTTYKTQFARLTGAASASVNNFSLTSYITLMEIGA
jgi:hypothetical protein